MIETADPYRQDRLAERARCRAITTAPEAELRQGQAQHLAFRTELPASEAVARLRTLPIDPRPLLH